MKKFAFLLLLLVMVGYSSMAQGVSFEIRNATVSNNQYVFDIYMGADQAGTFHSRGQVYLNYNPLAFGEKVVDNKRIQVTPGALLNQTVASNAKYFTVNVVDNEENIAAITWSSNFTALAPNSAFHTEVPMAATHLYHVAMNLVDASAATKVDFNTKLMNGQQFFLTGSNSEQAYTSGTLPVELLSFTGKLINAHDVKLDWATSTEINNDFFAIEKKKDNGEFAEIARVRGAGTTTEQRNYTYTDRSGMGNTNVYRLRVVDLSGAFIYSNEVETKLDFFENDKFVAFPSPATTQVTLKSTGKLDANYNFTVSDNAGKIVYKGVLVKEAPNGQFTLDVTGFAEGAYYISTTSADGKAYLNRFVKVNN